MQAQSILPVRIQVVAGVELVFVVEVHYRWLAIQIRFTGVEPFVVVTSPCINKSSANLSNWQTYLLICSRSPERALRFGLSC